MRSSPTSCANSSLRSPELATNGDTEVTARLTAIGGDFPPNKLYDYMYVMKYHVLKVHRGKVEGEDIFVGHYNPLKPRATAADKFSGKVGGNVDRFQVGDVHRMALEAPLDELFMGGSSTSTSTRRARATGPSGRTEPENNDGIQLRTSSSSTSCPLPSGSITPPPGRSACPS